MYHHVKKLMYTVRVDEPDPKFGNMLLEQFGGANGELAAAMPYSIQGLNCEDPARKDLLMDIGTEELSHLEIVGALARLHLKPLKFDRDAAEADPLIAIAGGGGVNLFNSQGNPWTADCLKITGGLLEEGDEIIEEGQEMEDAPADLALIAAAQKVEHYEMSAYGTARAMADQAGLSAVAELLNKSLAEEEISDNLLTQIARELMSQARSGATKAPKRTRTAGPKHRRQRQSRSSRPSMS